MNIYGTTEEIKKYLISETVKSGSGLKGFSVEDNPYIPLEIRVPFILLEGIESAVAAGGDGYPCEYFHSIEASVVVSGSEENILQFRIKAAEAAEEVIRLLAVLRDYRMKITPKEMTAGELMIGSLKCTGMKIVFEVRTLFTE